MKNNTYLYDWFCIFIIFIIFFFCGNSHAASDVGKLLEDAYKRRKNGTIEEVYLNFQVVASETTNSGQKNIILSLLADYLVEKQKWERAASVYEQILQECSSSSDVSAAHYALAKVFLAQGDSIKARAAIKELVVRYPDNKMEEYANYMKSIASGSSDSILSDFFREITAQDKTFREKDSKNIQTGKTYSIGKALEIALNNRAAKAVEEIIPEFKAIAHITRNPAQKAMILLLLADFLCEKQKWVFAVEIYEQIIKECRSADIASAYYGLAKTYLLIDNPGKAKKIIVQMNIDYPENNMADFARYMKSLDPGGVHAHLLEFFLEDQHKKSDTMRSDESVKNRPDTSFKRVREKQHNYSLGFRAWTTSLLGNFDSMGMNLDLSDDADISRKTQATFNAEINLSKYYLLSFDCGQFEHSGTISIEKTLDNRSYHSGDRLNINTNYYNVGFAHSRSVCENAELKLISGMSFSQLVMSLAKQNAIRNKSGKLTMDMSIPYLGLECDVKISGNLSLNGQYRFYPNNAEQSDKRFADWAFYLLFGPDYIEKPSSKEWYGILGYRFFLLHGRDLNSSPEIYYKGITFGFESRF
ncbi:MAG: tetratricopeptide repeat protein [Candidatus Riflebacteria bacterium]|nr:tetratricopeptide repeat protein [Candidatus Riflebacteria bacterium]